MEYVVGMDKIQEFPEKTLLTKLYCYDETLIGLDKMY